MKKSSYIITGILALIIIITGSCKKWIDPEINTDPNKPTEVTLNLLLPTAEAGIGYALGGDLKYAASMWMQQMAGGANQPLAYDKYIFTQSDVDNVWRWNLYAGPMMDCYKMIELAKAEGCPYYEGIAKVLMALQLGNATDLWGDIPYSEAFQGAANLKPKFDTQEEIYASLNSLLTEALANFDEPADNNPLLPGGEDLIYGGNINKWKMAANALTARFAIHMSKKTGATAYGNAIAALTDAFAGNGDDLEFYFGMATTENNPIFQFNDQRPYDIVVGAYLVDSMLAHNDPRLPLLADTSGGVAGSHAGAGEAASLIGPYYSLPNSPVPFISYVECKFIEAEARFQTGDLAGAATAHNEAVKASLAKFGVSDPAWEAIYANEADTSITLEKIMTQKYFALCYQLEVFTDWRRTGYPVLQPAANGVLQGQIARRYPYPTSEKNYNGNNVPDVTLTTKVWWDQ